MWKVRRVIARQSVRLSRGSAVSVRVDPASASRPCHTQLLTRRSTPSYAPAVLEPARIVCPLRHAGIIRPGRPSSSSFREIRSKDGVCLGLRRNPLFFRFGRKWWQTPLIGAGRSTRHGMQIVSRPNVVPRFISWGSQSSTSKS